MKLKEFFKKFFIGIKEGISRFLTPFICSILFFLTASCEIIFDINRDEIIIPLCMTFGLVAVLGVFLKITEEYITGKLTPIIQYIASAIVAIVSFVLINVNYESIYMIMAYSGIVIALLCFIFFVLMRGENCDLAFPRLVSSWIFAGAMCGVAAGGLSTCIAAFQYLIFTWDDIYKLYAVINLFVFVVGFVNIFLSFIPKKNIKVPQSKTFRIFVLFAGLPLYILLIVILLVYLGKIVIKFNMPVGEINWFASFASLFFIFFLLSVRQYNEKIAKLFVKYGGFFLIPVLVMQAIAVFERINAYGLTTPRTVSLVLIIISILFILGSVIMSKHLNKIALVSGIIVLFVTVTPFNIIDMPVKSQTQILTSVLTENDMIKDGLVVPNKNVSEKDAERIISSYEYLKYKAKKVPEFIPDSSKDFPEIFGFNKKYNYLENKNYIHCRFHTKDLIDITQYTEMLKVYDDTDFIKFEYNGKEYNIDLKQAAQNLYDTYGIEKSDLDPYVIDENVSLYFSNFGFDMEDYKVTYCHFSGYALLK